MVGFCLNLLFPFFWLCEEAQCVYLCLHLGWKCKDLFLVMNKILSSFSNQRISPPKIGGSLKGIFTLDGGKPKCERKGNDLKVLSFTSHYRLAHSGPMHLSDALGIKQGGHAC